MLFKSGNEHKERRRRIFFAKGMCLAMILVMSLILLYGFAIDSIKNTSVGFINELKIEKFEAIYTYMAELQKDGYDSAKDVSVKLEEYMKNMDEDTLKKELESGIISDDLNSIFHEVTNNKCLNGVDNSRNGFIIANLHGVIYDSNYTRADNRESRTWESEVKNSYNKSLELEAIDKLINKSASLIVTESVDLLKDENHIKLQTVTKDTLLDVYMKEGIGGLRNYQILCPAYITNNGDIFGQKDIVGGVRIDNNKIIVIQEFNLYDQIEANKPYLMDTTRIDELNESYSWDIVLLYIIELCFVGFTVVLLIYFSNSYNNYIDKYNLEDDEDIEGDKTYGDKIP